MKEKIKYKGNTQYERKAIVADNSKNTTLLINVLTFIRNCIFSFLDMVRNYTIHLPYSRKVPIQLINIKFSTKFRQSESVSQSYFRLLFALFDTFKYLSGFKTFIYLKYSSTERSLEIYHKEQKIQERNPIRRF